MSDFDAFESSVPQEEDPAAEFLAREQDQLAGLEDDGYVPAPQGGNDFGFAEPVSSGDMFDPMATDLQTDDSPPSDLAEPSSLSEPMAQLELTETIDEPQAEQTGFAAISQADKQRQEPEKIRLWREEQKKLLEEKDAEAEKRKAEWRKVAKHELEEWYKHRAEQFEKTKISNREHEEALIQERDESVPGHEWERICRLCEFNPKHSGNKKDVSRMRSILLQLKQSPLVR